MADPNCKNRESESADGRRAPRAVEPQTPGQQRDVEQPGVDIAACRALLSEKANTLYDYFLDKDIVEHGLYGFPDNPLLPQLLSRLFLSGVLNPVDLGVPDRDDPKAAFCAWLEAAYECLLCFFAVHPRSAERRLVEAILNAQNPSEPWVSVLRKDNGRLVFADASDLRFRIGYGRYEIELDAPHPFPFDIALKDGFDRIAAAIKVQREIHAYCCVGKIDLNTNADAIIDVLRSLQIANPKAFATGAAIRAFDFRRNVMHFLFHTKSRSTRRLM